MWLLCSTCEIERKLLDSLSASVLVYRQMAKQMHLLHMHISCQTKLLQSNKH